MDEFAKYVCGKVFTFYERGELSSAKQFIVETNKGIGFERRVVAVVMVLRILKSMGYEVCKMLQRLLNECSDKTAMRSMFLRTMYEI
jgi:hypothetical protein